MPEENVALGVVRRVADALLEGQPGRIRVDPGPGAIAAELERLRPHDRPGGAVVERARGQADQQLLQLRRQDPVEIVVDAEVRRERGGIVLPDRARDRLPGAVEVALREIDHHLVLEHGDVLRGERDGAVASRRAPRASAAGAGRCRRAGGRSAGARGSSVSARVRCCSASSQRPMLSSASAVALRRSAFLGAIRSPDSYSWMARG